MKFLWLCYNALFFSFQLNVLSADPEKQNAEIEKFKKAQLDLEVNLVVLLD